MTIYKITNKINGMSYIGQTTRSMEERWKEHCKRAFQHRSYLSNAIQIHGKENFIIEVLEKTSTQEELDTLEDKFILDNNSMFPNGYNLKRGGMGGKLSKEAIEKISKTNTGKKRSEHTKRKLSIAFTGHVPTSRRSVIGVNIKTGEIIRLAHPDAMPERFHYNCVHRCAKGERKSHKGFTWKYE